MMQCIFSETDLGLLSW